MGFFASTLILLATMLVIAAIYWGYKQNLINWP
jgi:hypothetical protein